LKELTGGTDDDVAMLVTQITEGTFQTGKSASSDAGSADGITGSGIIPSWETAFVKMTGEFRQVLRTHAKTDDTVSVRTALRSYISMLEDLYNQI